MADPFGKTGNNNGPDATEELINLSKQLFEETDPLRKNLISMSEDLLGSGITGTPAYTGLRSAADQQYNIAKKQIMESVPSGGALIDALTGASMDRARTLTQGAGNLYQNELNRATSIATGAPLYASTQGLGTAGSIQANEALAKSQQSAAMKSNLGRGVGMMVGMK